MTTTINASTSSGLVVTPDNSGNVLLQYNGVAAPAFMAYASANQTISHSTDTLVQMNAELFDTANCFNTSTYRFTPTVAGYYQINAKVNWLVADANRTYYLEAKIMKNGSFLANNNQSIDAAGGGRQITCMVSQLVYMNGTTDYLTVNAYIYDYTASSTCQINGNSGETYFSGCLLRGA